MVFHERLAELRKETGLSQKAFAERIKIENSKYNKWENGTNRPDFETVCRLATEFHVSTDYLLGHSIVRETVGDLINKEYSPFSAIDGLRNLAEELTAPAAPELSLKMIALLRVLANLFKAGRELQYKTDLLSQGCRHKYDILYLVRDCTSLSNLSGVAIRNINELVNTAFLYTEALKSMPEEGEANGNSSSEG